MQQAVLLTGTSKGLVVFHLKGRDVDQAKVHFMGFPVSMVYVDERNNTWWVGLSHRHWGEKLHYSTDRGKTWRAVGIPSYEGLEYRPGKPATLKRLWVMQHAGADRPDCFWIGTEPGGLFYSRDHGSNFHINESLWYDASRLDDNQWFGTGTDFPFIHTILLDPQNSDHIYIGVSCAGVFESVDGGKTWTPRNNGLIAGYLPKITPFVGHDPHQMLMCREHPLVIWQQNHCGIFRTINGGKDWINVSGESGWPSYGFALAIDHENPEVAWVIPALSDENRVPRDLRLQVCKTVDGGETWIAQSTGLPQQMAFDVVLRHGFIRQGKWMAFGTNNGNLYGSDNDGETWTPMANNLAAVSALAFSK